METPAQRCTRILTALEDLVDQEAVALANGDFQTLLALQDRTAPLVDFLVTQGNLGAGADAMTRDIRARLAAVRNRRSQNSDFLDQQIERTRAELQRTASTQRRVAQIGPVYGRASAPRRQLQAVG